MSGDVYGCTMHEVVHMVHMLVPAWGASRCPKVQMGHELGRMPHPCQSFVMPALLHDNVCQYLRSRHCNCCYHMMASELVQLMCECMNTASEVVHIVREPVSEQQESCVACGTVPRRRATSWRKEAKPCH